MIRQVVLTALLLTVIAAPVGAQQPAVPRMSATARAATTGVIDGVVSDTSLAPLRGAFVTLLKTRVRVGTGPNGRFRIVDVPAGQYILIVTRGGYSPTSLAVEVPAADTLRLAYTLTPTPMMLAGVTVTEKAVSVRMLEFEERRRVGAGQYMDAEQIERRNSVYPTELLRHFTSVNVSPSSGPYGTEYYALSKREGGTFTLGACPMTVYVDRVPMPMPFNLDMLPSPKNMAGIEVYSGPATTPPQFSGFNRGCGVILVWTRDGY